MEPSTDPNKRQRTNDPTTLDELWKQWEEKRAEELQKLEASRTPFPALGTPQAAMQATPQAAMQATPQAAMQAFPAQGAAMQAPFPAAREEQQRKDDEYSSLWRKKINSTLEAARTEEQEETWRSKIQAEIAAMQAAREKQQAELGAMRKKFEEQAKLEAALQAKIEAKRAKFPKPLDFGRITEKYERPSATLSVNEKEQRNLDDSIQKKMENATSEEQMLFYQMLRDIAPLIFNQERVTLGIMMSHGSIPVTRQYGLETFKIPKKIEIKYVPFSNPGASCFVSGIRKDNYVGHINNFTKSSYGVTEVDLNEMLTITRDLITETYCEGFDEDFDSMKDCKLFHEYGKSKGYSRITTVNPGESMVDYIYQNDTGRDDKIVLFLPNKTEPIDISMLLYNLYLLEYETEKLEYQDITLNRIVHFFQEFKVKQLVIFDFSCSNFLDINSGQEVDITDPEYQRLLKFMEENAELIKYGGKTRKTRSVKPRKTKKNHKRQKVSRKKKHPTTKRRTRH
jgi:hypothetical protein